MKRKYLLLTIAAFALLSIGDRTVADEKTNQSDNKIEKKPACAISLKIDGKPGGKFSEIEVNDTPVDTREKMRVLFSGAMAEITLNRPISVEGPLIDWNEARKRRQEAARDIEISVSNECFNEPIIVKSKEAILLDWKASGDSGPSDYTSGGSMTLKAPKVEIN